MQTPNKKFYFVIIILFFIGLIWSAVNPKEYFTWLLEVFPAIIGFIILTLTYKRFTFTKLVYFFILIHCWILFIGGHYTYAEVPLFDWIKDVFHQSRNNYDKTGHFTQGFVPALIIREIFIRKDIVKKSWRAFTVICICLAISAFYELIEWWTSLLSGSAGDAFLGTQGDIFDTQSDMFFALIGAITALLLFSKIQDKQIKNFK
jgi:putative membrane protein